MCGCASIIYIMCALRYFAILSNTSPGTNKIRVSRDVRFVGEATRNMVQVGTVGGHNDAGPHGDAISHSNVVPHDDKAQTKERIIYDTIEVLPPPRNKPIKSESDTADDESGETSYDALDDDGAMPEPTIETESFVSMLSSPKDPNTEIPTQRIRKPKPAPFDPASYVSAQDEAA